MNYKLYKTDGTFITDELNKPKYFTGIIRYLDGSKEWLQYGKRHRENGPAIVRLDGTKQYIIDEKLHRLEGPAYEDSNGAKYWYVDGEEVSEEHCKLLYDTMKLKGLI